jgi:hypothetical protein
MTHHTTELLEQKKSRRHGDIEFRGAGDGFFEARVRRRKSETQVVDATHKGVSEAEA